MATWGWDPGLITRPSLWIRTQSSCCSRLHTINMSRSPPIAILSHCVGFHRYFELKRGRGLAFMSLLVLPELFQIGGASRSHGAIVQPLTWVWGSAVGDLQSGLRFCCMLKLLSQSVNHHVCLFAKRLLIFRGLPALSFILPVFFLLPPLLPMVIGSIANRSIPRITVQTFT